MIKVNYKLKKYIEENIFPLYENNYIGDEKDRIDYVISRSESIVKENNLKVDYDILYTVICYHDIRKDNRENNHELVSAKIMYDDNFLKSYFDEEERLLIKEAIEDQRSNLNSEPRNIYGKILSSASRNSSIEQCLERSYKYGKKLNPTASDTDLFEASYNALLNKFGPNGYAKFYFTDKVYEKFLEDIRQLLSDKQKFINAQKEYIKKLNSK